MTSKIEECDASMFVCTAFFAARPGWLTGQGTLVKTRIALRQGQWDGRYGEGKEGGLMNERPNLRLVHHRLVTIMRDWFRMTSLIELVLRS